MKRKKHFAPAATSQEILDAVGVTAEERELARKLLKNIPEPYVEPKPLPYKETFKYSKEAKRELAKLAKSRWANTKKALEKLDGVVVKGHKITVVGPKSDKKKASKLLEDLKKISATLTPERIQEIRDETHARMKKDEEEARKPPKTPVGTCVVCKHDVTAEYVHGLRPGIDHRSVPIGPGGKNYYGWNFRGYSCVECGLMYKFAPKPHKAE